MKSFVFTLVLLALCTGGNVARASPACGKCRDRTGFKIGLVAYLDETDVIKSGDLLSGFLEAAKLVRVQPLVFKASPTSGTSPTRDVVQALSLELDNAMAAGVNAVVTVLPNLSGLEAKLQQLHDANITVVSVDTGHTALRTALADTLSPNSHLPLVHIGYDEEEEGLEAGRQLALAGGRHVICVLDGNVNDISSQTRCQGFADGFMSNCRADEACGVDTLTVSDMSNIELVNQEIEALVTGNPNINGVVSNKGKVLVRARQLLVKHERVVGTTYLVGAFGMDAEVQSMLTNRELTFAVDHQEYLNAFMATTIASYALAHRQAPASRLLSTRPHFTTVARAIERNLDMRVATSDVIIHGRSIDDFWKGFSVGIVEAANDLQLAFRECKDGDDTEACADGAQRTLTYRTSGIDFDLAAMAQRISRAASFKPDAMVVSVPNTGSVGDAIRDATRNKNLDLVSVNALSDDHESAKLGLLYHFGQDEELAGQRAALGLMNEGATHVLCLNQEAGNDALNARCAALERALQAANPTNKMTAINLPLRGSSVELVVKAIQESSADAMLVLGPPLLDVAIQARRETEMAIRIAVFDMLAESKTELVKQDSDVLFVVDQQQEMQAYMSVMGAFAFKISGQVFTSGTFETGPVLTTKAGVLGSGLACEAVPVCPLNSDTGDGDAGAAVCAIPFAKGDGWCDPANNVPACDYDGGDCCASPNEYKQTDALEEEEDVSGTSCREGESYKCGQDHFGVNLNAYQCVDPRFKCEAVNAPFRQDAFDPDCTSAIYALADAPKLVVQVMGLAIVCFCLLGVAFFIKYRGSRVVFFANPKLMVGIMIGAALVTFSALLGTFLHTWTICVARVFTFHLGLVLVLSCVLVKLYRLHRIFANTQLKVIRLPNTLLFAGVGALVMFGCCILSIWVLAFPASSSDLADAFSRNECLISTNDVGLTVSAGVYSGLLVLLNLYFVHRLERIVPLTFRVFLNDVKESARVIGHIALLGGFCVALGIGLNSSLERRTWLLLETLASLYFSIVSVVLFVVPKWLLIREDKSLQSHAYIKTTNSANAALSSPRIGRTNPSRATSRRSRMFMRTSSTTMLNSTSEAAVMDPGRLHSASDEHEKEGDLTARLQTKLLEKQQRATEKAVTIRMLDDEVGGAREQLAVLQTAIAEIKAELLYQSYAQGLGGTVTIL